MRASVFSAALVLSLAAFSATAQDRNTLLILDESGSMWAQLPEGRSRIEVARDVLSDYFATRDPSQPLGVVAYGHNRKGACDDIELIAPLATHPAQALTARLRTLMPRGKTPLAASLAFAAKQIPATAEDADIVLITDGLETCGGDPCAVAASLATVGIPVRAHVVGFGLTEGDIAQISCVAEQTGGMVLAPQSGADLAEALRRTTEAAAEKPPLPDLATLKLALDTDNVGLPDSVVFAASNPNTGESRSLGQLDFSQAHALEVTLAPGTWDITAKAGEQGNGGLTVEIAAGDQRTLYIPFTGRVPRMIMDQVGPYRLGASAIFPTRVLQEGLATGGADFVLTLLPGDATSIEDRPVTWSMQAGSAGAAVARLNSPDRPGRYLAVWHRYGETDLKKALSTHVIDFLPRPEVELAAPASVAPGATVPVAHRGGGAHGDRIEIWRHGALQSWDQSLTLEEAYDNEYGAAKQLRAPMDPGGYEIVYVFSDIDGPAAVAARVPLKVGAASAASLEDSAATIPAAEASAESVAEGNTQLAEDIGYACPADHGVPCIIDDTETGLLFALPPGWFTDLPTRGAAHAGAPSSQEGLVRVSFFSPALPDPDTVVLNPFQWIEMNGPCQQVQAGQLCHFASGTETLERGLEVLSRALRDQHPPARASIPPQGDALQQAITQLAQQDPGAAAAMAGLLDAASRSNDGHGPDHNAAGEPLTRAWRDYPHRCLPGDRSSEFCDMRDAASNLVFHLPESWVAEVLTTSPLPQAEFLEVGPGAHHIALNPRDWPQPDRACQITRAGELCRDPDLDDPALRRAFDTLRFTLTTGQVLRRCGKEDCTYAHPNPPFAGSLPGSWSTEVGRVLPDGRIASWFWDMDRQGNLKLLGLNQGGGEGCVALTFGDLLCDHTPYVSDPERSLIATTVQLPAPAARRVPETADSLPIDPAALARIDFLLKDQ